MSRMRERWRRVWMMVGAGVAMAAAPVVSHAQNGAERSPTTTPAQNPPTAVAGSASEPEVQRTYRASCDLGGGEVVCEVRLTVSRVVATVADRIEVVLEARAPRGVQVVWPEIGSELGGLNVLGVEDEEPIEPGVGGPGAAARMLVRRAVVLEPFLPGDREIERMVVRFEGGEGKSCEIATDGVKVEVRTLLEGEVKEPELRGVVEPGPAHKALYWVVVIVPPVIAMTVLVTMVIRRRRGKQEEEELSPYGAAMRRLERLDESRLLGEGRTSEFGTVLGETLREYVGGALGLPAAERTTEQLLADLGDQPSVNIGSLRELLGRLDEVSYAGAAVSVGEAQELRDRVYRMILGMQAARVAAEAALAGKPSMTKGGA